MFTETVIIAGLVALGLIVAGKALITAVARSRRPPHHLSTHTGASSVPPAVDIRPPE